MTTTTATGEWYDNTPSAQDPAKRANTPFPGAGGAGMIETVKRAVINALREAFTGTSLNHLVNGTDVTIDMEYPIEKENYPGIWVQFSFSEITQAGIGHEPLIRTVVEATPEEPEYVNWEPIREFQFKGRVSLTIVALTSLERDRLADAVITMLAFSRPPVVGVLTDPDKDTKQFRQLITSLAENPHVSITINHDLIVPGGQAMTTGVPWDEEIPGYEDTYSFDILGQTNIVFHHDGTYTLRNIVDTPVMITRYDWQ